MIIIRVFEKMSQVSLHGKSIKTEKVVTQHMLTLNIAYLNQVEVLAKARLQDYYRIQNSTFKEKCFLPNRTVMSVFLSHGGFSSETQGSTSSSMTSTNHFLSGGLH